MARINAANPKTWGVLIGFTKRWNPLSNEVFARVEVDDFVINIPIDCRQQNIIQKMYPPKSTVPLIFNEGGWRISSDLASEEHKLLKDVSTVF